MLIVLPWLIWKTLCPAPAPPRLEAQVPVPIPPAYTALYSQALRPDQLVQTKPGITHVISSSSAHVALVETRPGEHRFKPLTDDELLAFFAGRSAALVRLSLGHAELVFANSKDASSPFP